MKRILFLMSICFVFLMQTNFTLSGDDRAQKPKMAPLNPEFVKYLEAVKKGEYRPFTEDGHPLGYIPSPVDLSHVRGAIDNRIAAAAYPDRYDLRGLLINKVTPVKDQGECFSSWAFATYASLESYLMPSKTWDLSEQHLITNHGFDIEKCHEGNFLMSTAYLARWSGPLRENDVNSSLVKHIQQVIYLPARIDCTDNYTVKSFITTYGALYCSFHDDDNYYNSMTHSYYCDSAKIINHSVAIIGWDDNYSKSNFNIIPPENGAFLAKNSRGKDWGDSGYFYISYYDTNLKNFTSFNNAESINNYEKNYQYDPLGWTADCGYPNSTIAWGANIFTATDNQKLNAVGFYTTDMKVNYTIFIYRGCQYGKPRSGSLYDVKSGTEIYPGYHTVKLDEAILLDSGQRFSVVINFKNSSYIYPLAVEIPQDNYSSAATANEGESYIDADGMDTWEDLGKTKEGNLCIKAFTCCSPGDNPTISLSPGILNFKIVHCEHTYWTCEQGFAISNSGTGLLNWTINSDSNWLKFSPASGTNYGTVMVELSNAAFYMQAGTYTCKLSVIDPCASNSPRMETVTVEIINCNEGKPEFKPPFGAFETPLNGSKVSGSIPVTGWVLDDIEVTGVKIYNGDIYIGDAVFVQGARPDVETAYPGYPLNYRAGWGYMLLTNFLPNGGNGTYNLNVTASDKEGNVVSLGTKAITCDNAHAVKPFGAIDTPPQCGIASGSNYINWAWVLTPNPNSIPTDGSSINVYVDGVRIGSPHYNIYRPDIASLFPGYANSNGAVGYYSLDTTAYENGIHTISWTATDNAGNTDGIGSRYFMIENPGTTQSTLPLAHIAGIPVDDYEPIHYRKEYNDTTGIETAWRGEKDIASIVIRQDERLTVYLDSDALKNEDMIEIVPGSTGISRSLDKDGCEYIGCQVISGSLRPLPPGSTLDSNRGIFYWQPGPGFYGYYEFAFIRKDQVEHMTQKRIGVEILPKF